MKAFARETYILVRHCNFSEDYLHGISPYMRSVYLGLWEEEQAEIKKQMEEAKNKSKGLISAGGPMQRGVGPKGRGPS